MLAGKGKIKKKRTSILKPTNFNESPVAMQRYKRRTIANLDLIGHIFYLQNFQLNKKLKKLKKN